MKKIGKRKKYMDLLKITYFLLGNSFLIINLSKMGLDPMDYLPNKGGVFYNKNCTNAKRKCV